MRHLFKDWKKVSRELAGKHVYFFLDYDGTLAPIVSSPEKALIHQEVRLTLAAISVLPSVRLAIISGRSLADIKEKIQLKGIVYCGNHGMEIEGPYIKFNSYMSPQLKQQIKEICFGLRCALEGIKGAILEDKDFTLSLHYRKVRKSEQALLKKRFRDVLAPYVREGRVAVKAGKMVLEVRPSLSWNKAKAVMWLLAREKLRACEKEVLAVYLGDDSTDEDAFRALKGKGLTVLVGKPQKAFSSDYYLNNCRETGVLLNRFFELRVARL